ncbi:sodium/proline symporter [Alkalihalobacillus sp. BA299]|uniref:sodium/proline symporter n=1 Tax=Alkalihalobacillus sp. BA299 TaxID=2815938 RepID=UPI001ADC772E|nr:sodium/proline symporter [Alkalihalobacillus sp. BA299]
MVILVEIILYLLAMLGIGWYFSRKEINHSEFLLGTDRIPAWVIAFSERATGSSAWLMLGYTGFVFSSGLSAVWMAVGSILGALVAWIFLAKKFMKDSNEKQVLTLPMFIVERFDNNKRLILYSSSLLIVIFFIFYLGAQVAGAGKTLFTTFEISPIVAMVLCTLIVIILSFWGGFSSVVWTDMIQGIMMLLTLTVVPLVALYHIINQDLSISATLSSAGGGMDSWTGGLTGFALGILFFNNFSYFFGYLGGQPQLSSRFMALKGKKEVKIGIISVVIWSIFSYGGAFLIGLTARTLYNNTNFADVETILPFMINDLLSPWIAGLLLAGVIAAIITTANSQLMVIVSSITEDILNQGTKIKLRDTQLVKIGRTLVVTVGILGLVLAMVSQSLVLLVISWAWAGVGCTLSAVIILMFFWKRFSSIGAVATIITGLISTIIWISTPLEGILTSRFTTFFIAAFFGIVFSLLFPDKKMTVNQDRNSEVIG